MNRQVKMLISSALLLSTVTLTGCDLTDMAQAFDAQSRTSQSIAHEALVPCRRLPRGGCHPEERAAQPDINSARRILRPIGLSR
jgi:hypothetical protein